MSLEPKTFKVNNIEKKDYDDVHFIPAIVDDKEVYEVKNSSNLHCGYVTEAFLEALIKVSDEDGKLNQNFAVNNTQEWEGDITLLSRKIILDAPKEPSKILVQGVVLRPTIYPEEIEKGNKALTIATSSFRVMSPFCPLDIKVNHDSIEAESFSIVRIGGTADKSVTIDLDLATNKVGDLNIDGFYGESAFGGPYLKLKCTNEEVAPDITILGYTIDGNTNDKSEAGYIHFETAGEFAAREGQERGNVYSKNSLCYTKDQGSDKAEVEDAPIICDKIQMNKTSSSDSLIKIIARNSSEAEAKTKIPICLENIKLDSKACLEVNVNGDLSKEVSLPVEFKNTDFNQYNTFEIDGALSVENSFFKGLRLISNHDDKETTQKIDNSIFKSIVRLHNISKVSFSEINNTDISSNKEVEISNEFIKDQRIGDYEEFAKSRQARDSFDKDTSITEDLEVL